jgi:hypothetical protein
LFDGDILIVSNILIIILSRELINISKDDITSRSARTKRTREREKKANFFLLKSLENEPRGDEFSLFILLLLIYVNRDNGDDFWFVQK